MLCAGAEARMFPAGRVNSMTLFRFRKPWLAFVAITSRQMAVEVQVTKARSVKVDLGWARLIVDPSCPCSQLISCSGPGVYWPRRLLPQQTPESRIASCRLGGRTGKQYWISITPRYSLSLTDYFWESFPAPWRLSPKAAKVDKNTDHKNALAAYMLV